MAGRSSSASSWGPSPAAVMALVALLGLGVAAYIVGPPLYWHVAEALGRSAGACPACACDALPLLQLPEGQSPMFQRYSYKETTKATNNFSTVIGKGGFGTVYKAQFSDGSIAAVKRMDKVSRQAEEEFCREMELLAMLHHRHLVNLKGFCVERKERFLVYEYMENGSLKDHLHSSGTKALSWQTRLQIAMDVANALEYLHFFCNPPLCHRDIKSSNILLDENFVAKVPDLLAPAVPHGPSFRAFAVQFFCAVRAMHL